MFSINSGLRAPSCENVHAFWLEDPKAKSISRFFLSLPPLTSHSPPNTPTSGGSAPPEAGVRTRCPYDRFMDDGNTSIFDAAIAPLTLIPRKHQEFGVDAVRIILLDNLFSVNHEENNYWLGPKGLDYLNQFDYNRRAALREAAYTLGITEDSWMNCYEYDGDAARWIRLVLYEEWKIDYLLARIHINLRSWTMVKMLEQPEFNKSDSIAMLNTLYPPCSYELPNKMVNQSALDGHRETYFRMILKLESTASAEERANIVNLHISRMNGLVLHEWHSMRNALQCYLELSGIEIYDARSITNFGIDAFKRDSSENSCLSLFPWVLEDRANTWKECGLTFPPFTMKPEEKAVNAARQKLGLEKRTGKVPSMDEEISFSPHQGPKQSATPALPVVVSKSPPQPLPAPPAEQVPQSSSQAKFSLRGAIQAVRTPKAESLPKENTDEVKNLEDESEELERHWAPATCCRTIEDKLMEPNQPKLGENISGMNGRLFLRNVISSRDPGLFPSPAFGPSLEVILKDLEKKNFDQQSEHLSDAGLLSLYCKDGSERDEHEDVLDDMNVPIYDPTAATEGDFADEDDPPSLYEGYAKQEPARITTVQYSVTYNGKVSIEQKLTKAKARPSKVKKVDLDPAKIPDKRYLIEGTQEFQQAEYTRQWYISDSKAKQLNLPRPAGKPNAYMSFVGVPKTGVPKTPKSKGGIAEVENDLSAPYIKPYLAKCPGMFDESRYRQQISSQQIAKTTDSVSRNGQSSRFTQISTKRETATTPSSSMFAFLAPKYHSSNREPDPLTLLDSNGLAIFRKENRVGVANPLSLKYKNHLVAMPIEVLTHELDASRAPKIPVRRVSKHNYGSHLKQSKNRLVQETRGTISTTVELAKSGYAAGERKLESTLARVPGHLTGSSSTMSSRRNNYTATTSKPPTPSSLSKEWKPNEVVNARLETIKEESPRKPAKKARPRSHWRDNKQIYKLNHQSGPSTLKPPYKGKEKVVESPTYLAIPNRSLKPNYPSGPSTLKPSHKGKEKFMELPTCPTIPNQSLELDYQSGPLTSKPSYKGKEKIMEPPTYPTIPDQSSELDSQSGSSTSKPSYKGKGKISEPPTYPTLPNQSSELDSQSGSSTSKPSYKGKEKAMKSPTLGHTEILIQSQQEPIPTYLREEHGSHTPALVVAKRRISLPYRDSLPGNAVHFEDWKRMSEQIEAEPRRNSGTRSSTKLSTARNSSLISERKTSEAEFAVEATALQSVTAKEHASNASRSPTQIIHTPVTMNTHENQRPVSNGKSPASQVFARRPFSTTASRAAADAAAGFVLPATPALQTSTVRGFSKESTERASRRASQLAAIRVVARKAKEKKEQEDRQEEEEKKRERKKTFRHVMIPPAIF